MQKVVWHQSVVVCMAYLPNSYSVSNHSCLQGALHLLKVDTLTYQHPAQLQNRQEQSARWFEASSSGKI